MVDKDSMEHMDFESLHQLALMCLDWHTDFETGRMDCSDSFHHLVMVVALVLAVSFVNYSVNYTVSIHLHLLVVPMTRMRMTIHKDLNKVSM